MNITFFIGNGFDLNLGLKTRYMDFYEYFLKYSSEESIIRKWLEDEKEYERWADLEEALGQKLHSVTMELKDKFLGDMEELDVLLLEYLENEQMKISEEGMEGNIAKEFRRSILSIANGLSRVEKDSIERTKDVHKNEEFRFCFITFNYTDVLDRFIEITKKTFPQINEHFGSAAKRAETINEILHIHGTVNSGMVLGVNEIEQINSDFLRKDTVFVNYFVKKNINEIAGERNVPDAERIIADSHIICIYGMSMGITDGMWWKKIVEWLLGNENNKLIIFHRSSEEEKNRMRRKLPVAVDMITNGIREGFLNKGGYSNEVLKKEKDSAKLESIKKRILISYDADIFNFSDCNLLEPEE